MKITDLDAAAAIAAATGQRPSFFSPGTGFTGFLFEDNEPVTKAALAWITGEMVLPARGLLRTRRELYKRLRERGKQ